MTLEVDTKANAAYVRVADRPVASTRELDPQRMIDYDHEGEIIGIEFLAVDHGVDLSGLPHRHELEKLFDDHQIRQFA